jgi:hypothetical protein
MWDTWREREREILLERKTIGQFFPYKFTIR